MIPVSDNKRPDFGKAQDAATDLLLQQNINSLYIDVMTFQFDRRIIIDSVQHYAFITKRPVSDFTCDEFSGCCLVKHPRCSIILYDNQETNNFHRHWGIVHEVGHLYLNHQKDEDIEEVEANFFAAQVIMPEIALYEMAKRQGFVSVNDILDNFNASLTSAQKRINTLRRKGFFSYSKRDKLLLNKLSPYIDEVLSAQQQSS